ncbi:hypothetical protein BDV95DRAFT_625188 [Massariosphaeria phaeospora]|uniref:Uncharacterized protein n=1 Tax=Massariosphaeria phaeospora TaxID=100035 RepID=A0A7C8IGM4_9PLEO|nr:hypothetical protein BDV95DRAFT_625188 [Massariosphaeria phaeospora]
MAPNAGSKFTVTAVWAVPVLYKNENQPDPNVRLLQAIGVAVLSAVPMVTMSYLTAPFVATIHLRVPPTAAYTREALISFARNPPPSTLLEFTTLRIFPARKLTTTYLSELRALAPQRGRFANIELPKTKAWHDRQKQKGFWERVFQMMNEPRFKFYVKEGQSYTIRTRVPGVWEGVAGAIQQQTMASEAAAGKGGKVRTTATPGPTRLLEDVKKQKVVKRQTSRLRK